MGASLGGCTRCDCYQLGRLRAVAELTGGHAPVHEQRHSCRVCGGDPAALTRAFLAGMQAAAFDTYQENLSATLAREKADAERQTTTRWHE